MATFSLGTSGVTPGAPGVYINEQPGKLAIPAIAPFDTVYMLVETEEGVPVTRFPFNTPIAITSLNDYKELIRIGTSTVPEGRIPLLSYNCVSEFFQNARVGDLRVVRVGTPNQIVEIEFFPSATKLNSTDLPTSLQAGNKVYVQMYINGQPLVAGDGSTGYTSNGEWLGVPVTIPVTYVSGDEANNRRISAAIATAVAEAIESNPAIRSSVYVRSFGLLNDLDPIQFANSQNSFVSIAATSFDGNVSVVTEVLPVGSNFVFMQNAYDVENIVGGSVDLVRVPQDYTQCINTAFDGQQDQGYLITPTAYAQFDAEGRALVGAAAAAHCESNNFKWMALADPGPFLVTDINEYSEYTPHKAAADLEEGKKYLVDNAIYKWIGNDVSYPKLTNQTIVFGQSAETAVNESANIVSSGTKVGLLDPAQYTINAVASAANGVFELSTTAYWPVTLPIQQVNLQAQGVGSDFTAVYVRGFADDNPLITGPVYQINTITTVGGPTNGVYTNETVTPGTSSGTGLLATVVVAGGVITSVTITNGGNGYQPGETLTFNNPLLTSSTCVVQNVDVVQNISNTEVFVIAAPYNLVTDADYSLNNILLTTNAVDASNVYNAVVLLEGSSFVTQTPVGAVYIPNPTGDFATISYADPYWDIEVEINGQTSDLIENITTSAAGVNTLHLPGTLQDPTEEYILNWVSRTFLDPSAAISSYAGTIVPAGSASFNCVSHGLRSGQRIFFTQPITLTSGGTTSNFVSPTTKLVSRPYWVKVIDQDSFALANSLANFTTSNFIVFPSSGVFSTTPTIFYTQMLGRGVTTISPIELLQLPMIRGRKYGFDSNNIWNQALSSAVAPAGTTVANTPNASVYLNNSSVILGEDQITPYGEDISSLSLCGYLPKLNLVDPDPTPVAALLNAYCVPTVDQFYQSEAYFVPAIDPIYVGTYSGSTAGITGPVATMGPLPIATTAPDGVYNNVTATAVLPSTGTGLTLTITVNGGNITSVFVNTPGQGFQALDNVSLPAATFGATLIPVATLNTANGSITGVSGVDAVATLSGFPVVTTAPNATYTNVSVTGGTGIGLVLNVVVSGGSVTSATIVDGGLGYTVADTITLPSTIFGAGVTLTVATLAAATGYAAQLGINVGDTAAQMTYNQSLLNGCYFGVTAAGTAPDGTPVVAGDRLVMTYNGSTYDWVVVPADTAGGDLTSAGQPCYGSQVELLFTPEQGVPTALWRFDAITSTEIIDDALRGVGFNGVPQAEFVEAGVDNVNRLYQDSQRYFNPFGFIAYYGPYIENGAGQWIPPSPYVTGVALRRYRSEGYQFPPAGVKFQLADAVATQIPINSAQQNLLNPDGCNAVRTLPGYPDTAVFIWGGRTRINPAVAEQRLYQFVNTRVILNVVYGSLRTAFDNQIFNVIDGFNVVYNQIVSVGNSILNQLYVQGALFGARPSDAFQVICDPRINPPEDLENGIVNAKVFVTPVPTLERIQIDLIRVAIGQMKNELDIQGLG